MKPIRIEKRIPFGFRGDWGKLYKKNNYDVTVKNVFQWVDTAYFDLGQDVQFKLIEDRSYPYQLIQNYVTKANYRVVETTDAYFDEETGDFECVAEIGDIVLFRGRWYVVEDIEVQSIYSPRRHSFFFIALKNIKESVMQVERD